MEMYSILYHDVMRNDPYPGLCIKQGECVGHYKKRLGIRYMISSFAYNIESTKLSGKERLTEEATNLLQNHQSTAVTQNTNNIRNVRKAIRVAVCYSSEGSLEETRHLFYLKKIHTQCKWQKGELTGENKYKEKVYY